MKIGRKINLKNEKKRYSYFQGVKVAWRKKGKKIVGILFTKVCRRLWINLVFNIWKCVGGILESCG